MKAGILESHRVVTVSPHYAQELLAGPDTGCELDNYLRITCVSGIKNGMDVQDWNPATNKYLSVKYDVTTVSKLYLSFISVKMYDEYDLLTRIEFQVMDAKPMLKEALQAEVGLPIDRTIPVICFLGRLEEQKGPDILAAAIPQIIDENVQIIILV